MRTAVERILVWDFEQIIDDQLRQTTFFGWRDDKKAKEVVLELTQTA
jgi:hypothetical protein